MLMRATERGGVGHFHEWESGARALARGKMGHVVGGRVTDPVVEIGLG
ncbi:hypothetical protein SAMN02745121_00307 [Nannocystis exedens]|uniref:Uncharacterized protein n=1 Tax=Nannocystis exedens TaxID=54 RepID=A0A1I1T085_9BACT|nr:hypothetical protein NAEX_09561 [Nannocystis exedens]SFD50468.1 hypothetical protein SAMN02745121_00307 [Nannocystis exedens]